MTNYQQYGGQQPSPPAFPQQPSPPAFPQQPLPPAFPQQHGQQYAVPQQPAFGWGPQFGPGTPSGPGMTPGPGWQQQPRKKRNTGLLVSLGLLGVVLVAGFVAIAINLDRGEEDGPVATGPTPATRYTPPPTSEPTYPPSTFPTTRATRATQPTRPAPTRTTPAPPPEPSARQVATRDSFYFTGLHRSVGCREASARATSVQAANVYYQRLKTCLDRAWPRQLRLAKDPFRAPRLIAMSGPAQSPCGGGAPSSFYCSANETIYMDAVRDVKDYRRYSNAGGRMWVRMAMTNTVAHEYAHHLQWLSGILSAHRDLAYEAPTRALELEYSRRLEIQATCFGAVFMGANKSSYPLTGRSQRKELDYLVNHMGDEYGTVRDHGSREIKPFWFYRGFNTRNNAMCNTFTASARMVR